MKNNRYQNHSSEWVRNFDLSHLNILIVCRGPIRKEAMDVFEDIGINNGILLSEKDSVSYPHTVAPELRQITDPDRVHRVPDYTGATAQEKKERINQIIEIAKEYNYSHIFAGYGFMAEDAVFVEAIEKAGLGFIGPRSTVHRLAGAKDYAKKLARNIGVSVTPGVDNITSLALLRKAGNSKEGLEKIASENGLQPEGDFSKDDLEAYAEAILEASYQKGLGLIKMADLQTEGQEIVAGILQENPGKRVRLKYIGGGGGKGQRIVTNADEVPNAVTEVLSESRAIGDADNKNFLIEMNIENTRHNEIQLIGNGEWAVALGGRDCSLQMHEQKLVELSITDELFQTEIEEDKKNGNGYAAQLEKDRKSLQEMEKQAEDFAVAVGLNSASTFECIVSEDSFYFMEVNTRIQVEHRVTEMVYSLKFVNPENPADFFIVESLVEAMALCAAHGEKLPRPERVARYPAGGEVRLNAMNDALAPHAGGLIEHWSSPVKGEIRDDQGIGIRNPDTGGFMHYYLAGAYDSNIALVVTHGKSRSENLEKLADTLRQMELRGQELKTNREFHYGIVNFCMGLHPMLKPNTGFVVPYLASVGALATEIESIDIDAAWKDIVKRTSDLYGSSADSALRPKLTLINRPLKMLITNPHILAGWLFRNLKRSFRIEGHGEDAKIHWLKNPLAVLNELYYYLRLEERDAPPSQKIWIHDHELLLTGLSFYQDLKDSIPREIPDDFASLDHLFRERSNPFKELSNDIYQKCRAAHFGWQAGLAMLEVPIRLGIRSGILEFDIDDKLHPLIPEKFHGISKDEEKEYLKHLAPPPVASADTIVAVTGGMYYARETPDSPKYLEKGSHFNAGDPIYIIEVMKMFNKIHAEFSGTVEEVMIDGDIGTVVKKGQPLFKVKPDEEIYIETEEEAAKRRAEYTKGLAKLISI